MPGDHAHLLPTPFATQSQKQKTVAYLAAITLAPLLAIYFKFGLIHVLAGFVVVAGLALSIFSIRNTIILLLVYISFLPNSTWGERYPFFRGLYFKEFIACGIIGVILLWLLAEIALGKKPVRRATSAFDIAVAGFLIITILGALHGGFANGNFVIIFLESFFLCCYAFYFIYVKNLSDKQVTVIWHAFMAISVGVAFQFILLALSTGSTASLLIKRVSTQQPHLGQIAIPLFLSHALFAKPRFPRMLSLCALVPLAVMIFFSQQRGLWVGVIFSIAAVLSFWFFRHRFSARRALQFVVVAFLTLAAAIALILIMDRLFTGSIILTLLSRFSWVENLSMDESTNIRLSEIMRALGYWSQGPLTMLFGTGLGASYHSIDATRTSTFSVDNSYIPILWKLGYLGLFCYLAMMWAFVRRGLYVFRKSTNMRFKQVAAGLLSGMGGLAIIALTNACLVRYRFVVVWSLAMATIEILYRKCQSGTEDVTT